ncbi:MAG: 4-vinyl reductase [Anaerolineae bacterium]|nr:4-vinyl reductase [Anaerolineae bacterium]
MDVVHRKSGTLPIGLVLADSTCGVRCRRQAEQPICHLYIGSSEAVQWATGQEVGVREIECRAMGAQACHFPVAEGGERLNDLQPGRASRQDAVGQVPVPFAHAADPSCCCRPGGLCPADARDHLSRGPAA